MPSAIFAILLLAQDPLPTYPNNYRVVLDNSEVRVIRVHYGPHEKLGVHDHPKTPTVYVYLNDGPPVRFEHFEKKGFTLDRPATTRGGFRVSPGRVEQHTAENLGEVASDFLRVELKQISLTQFNQGFRGPAPRALLENKVSVELRNPFIEIDRVICNGDSTCRIEASSSPSLVVAFSPLMVKGNTVESGGVRWLESSEEFSLE